MPAAAFLDVALIVAQGELGPAAPAVMAGDLAIQADLLAGPGLEEGDQARALRIDEHHQRGRRLSLSGGEGTQERPVSHDDRVLQGSPDRDHLAEAQGGAGEERHAAGVGVDRLADERLSLGLDPVEGIGQVLPGLASRARWSSPLRKSRVRSRWCSSVHRVLR